MQFGMGRAFVNTQIQTVPSSVLEGDGIQAGESKENNKRATNDEAKDKIEFRHGEENAREEDKKGGNVH